MINYYKILGVNKSASIDEIKMAYKRLAMKYHPDRNPNNPNAEEKFKEIKNAYEVLTNKNKDVEDYNDFGFSFNDSDFNFENFNNSESSLNDIFNVIFNKNFKKDYKFNFILNISLEQAVYGSKIPVKINLDLNCDKCFGKGVKNDSKIKICSKCSGSGLYTVMQGIFTFKQKCYKCNGKGYSSYVNCSECKGEGKYNKFFFLFINVPKNSNNNDLIKIELNDVNVNNLYIIVKIKSNQIFTRKDIKSNDLYTKLVLDFIKSIFGGCIKIHTIYGYILYKIKNYIQSGDSYKLKYLGLILNKFKKIGDLYVEIYIEIPLNINIYQKLLIRKLQVSFNKLLNYKIINNWNFIIFNFYKNLFVL